MDTYLLPEMADLGRQLPLSPTRLRLRQIAGIEYLLSVCEPQREYPYELVCFHITGHRLRSSVGDGLLAGGKLISDLALLAEQLSRSVPMAEDVWGERLWRVEALAERFSVSAKTISRWRSRGLLGLRVAAGDGRPRLAFRESSIRRFVAHNDKLVRRGKGFTQLTAEQRDELIEAARTLAADGKSLHAVARTLARRTGRAVETIRYTLRAYEQQESSIPIFPVHEPAQLAETDHEIIERCYRNGDNVRALAKRFERTPSSIYRIIAEVRAARLRRLDVQYIYSPEFERPDADQAILDGDPSAATTPSEARPPRDLPVYLQQLYRLPMLSRVQEQVLFRRYNYLKFKAAELIRTIDAKRPRSSLLDRIERLLASADRLRTRLTQANLRLVVSIARRHVSSGTDFYELVSDGNLSLMQAVEKFDYTRGNKFSTYATWAIRKNYARTIPEQRSRRARFQATSPEILEAAVQSVDPEPVEDETAAARGMVRRLLTCLDERERAIVTRHYGLVPGGRKHTLQQIGNLLGVTKERVRQIEQRALDKLRRQLGDQQVAALSG